MAELIGTATTEKDGLMSADDKKYGMLRLESGRAKSIYKVFELTGSSYNKRFIQICFVSMDSKLVNTIFCIQENLGVLSCKRYDLTDNSDNYIEMYKKNNAVYLYMKNLDGTTRVSIMGCLDSVFVSAGVEPDSSYEKL